MKKSIDNARAGSISNHNVSGKDTIRISKDKLKKLMFTFLLAGTILGSIATTKVNAAIDDYNVDKEVNSMLYGDKTDEVTNILYGNSEVSSSDREKEVATVLYGNIGDLVEENTHHINGSDKFYYDHAEIANGIKSDNIEESNIKFYAVANKLYKKNDDAVAIDNINKIVPYLVEGCYSGDEYAIKQGSPDLASFMEKERLIVENIAQQENFENRIEQIKTMTGENDVQRKKIEQIANEQMNEILGDISYENGTENNDLTNGGGQK